MSLVSQLSMVKLTELTTFPSLFIQYCKVADLKSLAALEFIQRYEIAQKDFEWKTDCDNPCQIPADLDDLRSLECEVCEDCARCWWIKKHKIPKVLETFTLLELDEMCRAEHTLAVVTSQL